MRTQYHLFDHMMEGVQVINPEWKYIYTNDMSVIQSKTTKEALLGHTMMECYPGIEKTALFSNLTTCMLEGKACRMINEFTFPDGSNEWFDLRMEPVEDGVLIMSFNITEQKQMEQELIDMNAKLDQTVKDKTEELQDALKREKELSDKKSGFISIVSHEFRTPLSTILSSASLIERYSQTDQQDKRYKQTCHIKSAVINMTVLLDDFLSLEKLEQGMVTVESSNFDISEFVEDVNGEISKIAKCGQEINYFHQGARKVYLDQNILRNVLYNLLSNAIKYSESNIEIKTHLLNEKLDIAISDKGIGIPEVDQAYLFQKFFRASNARLVQGTGLGLNIVKQYIDLMGGSISFKSKIDKGTTFLISLPECSEA